MPKKVEEKVEILAEDEDGNWIQVHYEDGNPEWYDLFFVENTVLISMLPESFDKIVKLFKSLE